MPFDRRRTRRVSRPAADFAFPAPIKGLTRAGLPLVGDPATAEVLENFIPTPEGARMRGGSTLYATLGAAAKALLTYRSGTQEALFGVTDTTIYPITNVVDATVAPAASVTGLTSSDWSSTQFATPGGQFLIIANGADSVRSFDGTTWAAPAITGVAPADLHSVWQHKARLWFAEDGLNWAWYLPLFSIAGAASAFPLHGIFKQGGTLLFGASISADTGAGPDDMMCFVSSLGEVAIYQGTDPSIAATWGLVGIYQIGRPLHKNAHFKVGGDVLVATEEGIVSLLAAMTKPRDALRNEALTARINEVWQAGVARSSATDRWPLAVWPSESLVFISLPLVDSTPEVLVVHTLSRGWATITGWNATCWAHHADGIYFGAASTVAAGDTGGSDRGTAYTARLAPAFQDFGTPALKSAVMAQVLWRGAEGSRPRVGCFVDYNRIDVSDGGTVTQPTGFTWGAFTWGSFVWGSRSDNVSAYRQWHAISGHGMALAPTVSLTSNQVAAPDFTLLGIVLRYEQGAMV